MVQEYLVKEIILPGSITTVPNDMFSNFRSLTNVTLRKASKASATLPFRILRSKKLSSQRVSGRSEIEHSIVAVN